MRKLSILALVALFVTGSAFAGLTKAPNATFPAGTAAGLPALGPSTTNNDDSCDIGTAPAATLLLPYFGVDLGTAGTGRTTIFSVTNVSPYSQIAHVTVWTDWSYPVLDFNIFLTGYDVQPINMYDVIARGLIGSTTGTGIGSNASYNARTGLIAPGVVQNSTSQNNVMAGSGLTTSTGTNPNVGSQPFAATTGDFNGGNPNFATTASANCAAGRLPGQLPQQLANDVRLALTTGTTTGTAVGCANAQVGGNHGATFAVGYVTIDVAATCGVGLPVDPTYYTSEILFDNVLIGDYQDINQSTTTGNYAGGNPLVHIRAVPEGGPAGGVVTTNLPFTFYDRYTAGNTAVPTATRTVDRRQPLPSAFAARWISGSTAAFDTAYKIWREGFTGGTGTTVLQANGVTANTLDCGGAGAPPAVSVNQAIPFQEIVRFDEHENAGTITASGGIIVSPQPITPLQGTPETSLQPVSGSIFPAVAGTTDAGGWTYFNLNNGGNAVMTLSTTNGGLGYTPTGIYSAGRVGFTLPPPTGSSTATIGTAGVETLFNRDVSQNWVILEMTAEGRYGVDQDANWLGNGCSAPFPLSANGATGTAVNRIAPAGGVLVCPTGTTTQAGGNTQCTGTNVTP
ncbi:MAG TPA: hypothetical protein VI259_08725 [Gemmatimonadaceae bacterium]